VVFKYAGGIEDFVRHLNASKEPLFKRVGYLAASEETQRSRSRSSGTPGYHEGLHSFANGIATNEGGMHEEGFKKALTNAVNKYAKARGLLKDKDENLLGEDIREGLTGIISVGLQDPQFEGQTKAKLGNVSMRSLVERSTNERLGDWLEEHPPEARQIVQKSLQAARARMAARQARDATRARARSRAPACPASSPTARCATPARPRSSSSRATPPVAPPSRPATPATRRSSRSAARSSTSSGPASTRC
jgi:DNA gyrase subunit B